VRRDLVEQAQAGDREAFASLAADSIGRLFTIAQLMLRDRDVADDAVQEALVTAWRDVRGLRDPAGFDAWLRRVLVRCVYREARRTRRHTVGWIAVPEILGRDDTAREFENRDTLERGFRRLKPEHRAVLVLHYYLGYSDEEAADALSVPPGTVKSRLNRATSALRAVLEADARTAWSVTVETVR
jgi:RNA polymerase sigma-70 factor (ECF subfamily)